MLHGLSAAALLFNLESQSNFESFRSEFASAGSLLLCQLFILHLLGKMVVQLGILKSDSKDKFIDCFQPHFDIGISKDYLIRKHLDETVQWLAQALVVTVTFTFPRSYLYM